MPLDGIFLHYLTDELQCCVGCRADKIHQPSKDELVFLLRSAAFTGKLLISAKSGSARVHITSASFENPPEPPNFCKLLRKHLSSAKIMSIEQDGLERTVKIRFLSYNEMGDTVYPFIAVELITGRANIILCDETGRIIDALHRSDIEASARLIQPGAMYTSPEKETKLNPFSASAEDMTSSVLESRKALSFAFCAAIDGISPLVSRELAAMTGLDVDECVSKENAKKIIKVLEEFKGSLNDSKPYLLFNTDENSAKDFSYMPINQYGNLMRCDAFDTYSPLLDAFYAKRDAAARMKARSQDILRLAGNIKSRIERRLAFRIKDLEKCKDRETFRIYGELLKANLYGIEKGAATARVQNYYDESLSYVTIPLDPALSPAANAAKYFKEYKKTYTAEQTLSELIKNDRKELAYIDSVLDSLSRCKTGSELDEIRDELAESGYVFRKTGVKKKAPVSSPKEYFSNSGFKILVGRNNRENDILTLKTAAKHDLWFHTKNIAGSHVILITEGKTPDNDTLLFAASLAAANSKAAYSENVPVDFTEARFVKKPSGAKPGMVIYTDNKTLFVKPYEN